MRRAFVGSASAAIVVMGTTVYVTAEKWSPVSTSVTNSAIVEPDSTSTSANPVLPPNQPKITPQPTDRQFWNSQVMESMLESEHYESVRGMTDAATAVVRGRVVDVQPTRLVGREVSGDPGVQLYGLTVRVDELLAGRLDAKIADNLVVVEVLAEPSGASTAESSILFLRRKGEGLDPRRLPAGEESYYRFVSSQGVAVEGPNRKSTLPLEEVGAEGSLANEVRQLSMSQLRAEVLEAARS